MNDIIMDMDIVQLRWQQIRSFEASQAISAENVELKSQIIQLKALQKETDRKNKQSLRDLARSVQSWIIRARVDMTNLTSSCMNDLAAATQSRESLQRAFEQLQLHGSSHDMANQFLQNERKRLLQELEEAHEAIAAANKSKLAEMDRNHASIEQIRAQLAASDSHRDELLGRIDEYEAGKTIAQQRYDALHRQCEGLVLSIQRMEMEQAETLQLTREAEQRLLADHESQQQISQSENEQLRLKIAALEEQIERLTAALMGNKSHFHKYVELKTENVGLHAELKNISKKASSLLLVPPTGPSPSKTRRIDRDRSPGGSVISRRGEDHLDDASTVTATSTLATGRSKGTKSSRAIKSESVKYGLAGTAMPIAHGRHRTGHSPIRSTTDDDNVSVGSATSALTAGTSQLQKSSVSNVPNAALRVSIPHSAMGRSTVSKQSLEFTQMNDETTPRDRDFLRLQSAGLAAATDSLGLNAYTNLPSPRGTGTPSLIPTPGPIGAPSSMQQLRLIGGRPPEKILTPRSHSPKDRTRSPPIPDGAFVGSRGGAPNGMGARLPLSVPLMSKGTRDGLASRHVNV